MKTYLLILSLILGHAPAFADDDAITLTLPSGPYWLTNSDLRRGDLAVDLHYTYPMGHARPTAPPASGAHNANGLKMELQNSIKTNQANQDAVDRSLKDSLKTIGEGKSVPLPLPAAPTPSAPVAAPLDFEACAKQSLAWLKQKLRVEAIAHDNRATTEDRLAAQRGANALATRLEVSRGAGGAICGKDDPYLKNVAVTSDIEQIKILSALSNRRADERIMLLKTLALAYGPMPNLKVRETWRALWSRLSLLAVFTQQPLPVWTDVADALKVHPNNITFTPTTGMITTTVNLVGDTSDVDANLAAGQKLIGEYYGKN